MRPTQLALAVRAGWRKLGWRAWALVLAWAVHYLNGVRRVRLHLAKTSKSNHMRQRMQRIMEQCPSMFKVYWPTWYAYSAMQQILLLGVKEIRAIFQSNVYTRQIFQLRDSANIALDWVVPERELQDGPVCILLHGAIQDSRSSTMKDLASELAQRGLLAVVMNRRGYGDLEMDASTARVTLFGFDEDLDEVMLEVGKRAPGRPVAIVGFSCGSGQAGRYAAHRQHLSAWQDRGVSKTLPRLLCVVGYDAGYDVLHAVHKVPWPYCWALDFAFRYQYVIRHRSTWAQKSPSSAEVVKVALDPTQSFAKVYRNVTKLSGFGCSTAWLENQQPQLNNIEVPCLLINSRDDPICVWQNVEDHKPLIQENPNLALVELRRGSHGCKFGFWGFSSMGRDMIGEFILSSWSELKNT
ncbi:unnamed protein product [Effrenium voratum]|nr:unnamed protein product [Effrenium voratum]|mmetsp:Transcript_88436/g.211121  ORF Transcript_88436/g.211121 Transcript_88436/m.211121 type:complete len:410 (+) Transcript_88436:37-1266(+)